MLMESWWGSLIWSGEWLRAVGYEGGVPCVARTCRNLVLSSALEALVCWRRWAAMQRQRILSRRKAARGTVEFIEIPETASWAASPLVSTLL
jgi:hypothetical protein